MQPILYLIFLLMLIVFFLIRAKMLENRWQIYIFKPAATLLVIAVVLLSFLNPGHNTFYSVGILIGLFFSLGGDISLLFQENRKAFALGVGFFLLTQVAYSVVFIRLGRFSTWDLISFMILSAAGWSFYTLLKSNLGKLKLPVIIYIIVISLMVNRALSLLFRTHFFTPQQAVMITLGAVLFYLSDVIFAANRFWKPWKYHHISLLFYYTGQLLIALAACYFE